MRIIILSFLFFTSCVTSQPAFRLNLQAFSDRSYWCELDRHVARFEALWGKKTNTPILMGDIRDGVGSCNEFHKEKVKLILIDKKYYDNNRNDDAVIEYLVFHELGHCELKREHLDEVIFYDGKYMRKSIMHSGIPTRKDFEDYEKYRDYYIKELFHRL